MQKMIGFIVFSAYFGIKARRESSMIRDAQLVVW